MLTITHSHLNSSFYGITKKKRCLCCWRPVSSITINTNNWCRATSTKTPELIIAKTNTHYHWQIREYNRWTQSYICYRSSKWKPPKLQKNSKALPFSTVIQNLIHINRSRVLLEMNDEFLNYSIILNLCSNITTHLHGRDDRHHKVLPSCSWTSVTWTFNYGWAKNSSPIIIFASYQRSRDWRNLLRPTLNHPLQK